MALAALIVILDELVPDATLWSLPRPSQVLRASVIFAMNYDPQRTKSDEFTCLTNPCVTFMLRGLWTSLVRVGAIEEGVASTVAGLIVVIDRLPITLDVAMCRRFGSPDAYLEHLLGSYNKNRLLKAYEAYIVNLLIDNLSYRGVAPAVFTVGSEQPAFATRLQARLEALEHRFPILGHFLHPDAFLRAYQLKKDKDIAALKANPLGEEHQSLNTQGKLYDGSDDAVVALLEHARVPTSGPALYGDCFRRLGDAFKVLGAARSARSKALWEGEDSPCRQARTAGSAAPRDRSSRSRPPRSQGVAAGNYGTKWGDASVDGARRRAPASRGARRLAAGVSRARRTRRTAPSQAKADGKFSNFKYATPAEAAAANRATRDARDARVRKAARSCFLPGGCDGSSGGCEIPEGKHAATALVKMLTDCATCRRRAKVILEAPDPRSPDLIPAAEKLPGPWFFTALSLAKAANVCPVMGQYNEDRYKSAATLARDKRRLEVK
ncbi:hypothetical protein JL721_9877 [Aureococcus anophagefferens]|nr:hypothetical protein JL721_9877 [Aureococcus anophagefferens]